MDTTPSQLTAGARLAALRAAMAASGVDGYLVPRADEHQAEYVPAFAERLQWLTGFTGSAGLAAVLADRAAIFVDGRYTLQVRDQVDNALYEYCHLIDELPAAWLAKTISSGMKLGFDPKLHTAAGLARLEEACARTSAVLVPVDGNLIDKVWTGQPSRPGAPIEIWPEVYAGRASRDKREQIAGLMKAEGVDALVISALDSLAWLFNIRGQDVEFSPLVLGYAVVMRDARATFCVEAAKVTAEVKSHLGTDVTIAPYDAVDDVLKALPDSFRVIGLDRDTASRWLQDRVAAARRTAKLVADPVTAVKARKQPAEITGVRAAHVRDGAAVVRFLAWLAGEVKAARPVTEISAADRLAAFRAENALYRGPSFPTIAGAAGNGAIVHYRATPESNASVRADMVLLLDSGGQYLDGTTDITRTIAIGNATAEQKHRFTLVLKGHIALAQARFVKGTTGSQLDVLARQPLWREGFDFDHGTGHGVGTFLGVHEGPQRIGKMGNTVALEPGMLISNEPGYYKTGAYGIRIENLVIVREAAAPDAEKPLYEFETVTLAPIDRAMIARDILTDAERAWLDAYHARVRETLSPQLDVPTRAWLEKATALI